MTRYYDLDNSFVNYHVPGVDYLCLLRTPSRTLKVYDIVADRVEPNEEGFLATPHDHAYRFTTTVLDGRIANKCFEVKEADKFDRVWVGDKYVAWKRFNGAQDSHHECLGVASLSLEAEYAYLPGERYIVLPDETHTLSWDSYGFNSRNPVNTMLFLEQERRVRRGTRMFTKSFHKPSVAEGTYAPMSKERADEIYDKFMDLRQAAHL